MSTAPLILDIKGNALDDGPGIRSVVFFKGCLLGCDWCHNPESMSKEGEISFEAKKCLETEPCRTSCEQSCPEQAIHIGSELSINRDSCTLCYECVDACPTEAITRVGEAMSVDEVYQRVAKYKPFYDSSGGGVTVSGGEPTLHMEFLSELLQKLSSNGIHTLLQTCGLFPYEKFMRLIYPYVDTIYFDLKLNNDELHRQHCGASNDAILSNFEKLQQLYVEGGVRILARTPLVPGITGSEMNLTAIAEFLKKNQVTETELMAYNPIWHDKREKLGYLADVGNDETLKQWMSQSQIDLCEQIFSSAGLTLL
ncbi:MAG: glycyl-radical enzyme activating protein [Pseudomonadales bacterium]|nr:glycyl-radical enzyme activating protein [Pseudomonadales bacterium]